MERYHGRRAARIENAHVRVTVLQEGGHIAEILDKASGVNPLWTPPWPTIEPSAHGAGHAAHVRRRLRCPPARRHHGAQPVPRYLRPAVRRRIHGGSQRTWRGARRAVPSCASTATRSIASAHFPIAGLVLRAPNRSARLSRRHSGNTDEHRGHRSRDRLDAARDAGAAISRTWRRRSFRASATRSKVFESTFGAHDYLTPAAEFDWPMAPRLDGAAPTCRIVYRCGRIERLHCAFDGSQSQPCLLRRVFSRAGLVFGYVWRPADFPWMGIWEENRSRLQSPWNGQTRSRGMEFGVSPMPETRRAMIERAASCSARRVFDRYAAGASVSVEYCAIVRRADANSRIPRLAGVTGRYG